MDLPKTVFVGYDQPVADAVVLKLFVNGGVAEEAKPGDIVTVILDKTPFYAAQGGQCADTGIRMRLREPSRRLVLPVLVKSN